MTGKRYVWGRLGRGASRILRWQTPLMLRDADAADVPSVSPSSRSAWLGRTQRSWFEGAVRLEPPAGGVARVHVVQRAASGEALSRSTVDVEGDAPKWVRHALADAEGSALELSVGGATPVAWSAVAVARRRTVRELVRLGRGAVAQYGWRGLPRRLWVTPAGEDRAAAYRAWVQHHTPAAADLAAWQAEAAAWSDAPLFSILTPVHNTDPTALRECWHSVTAQVYTRWEWCVCDDGSTRSETGQVLDEIAASHDERIRITRLPASRHISVATNTALASASGTFVALLDHDDTLAPEALFAMARHLRAHPDEDLVYSDEDKLDEVGQRCEPAFKPDWSPDLLRAWMYPCHLTVIRRALLEALGGLRVGFEGAQDYDLWLRACERTEAIGHVPQVLYHWRKSPTSTASSTLAKPEGLARSQRALQEHLSRRGVPGRVEAGERPGLWRVRYALETRPVISIIVPTDGGRPRDGGGGNLLLECLQGLVGRTAYPKMEIVVAHNGVLPAGLDDVLAGGPHRVVQVHGGTPFNFARKLNAAARHATGEYLLLLNDDIVVRHPDWLDALLEHAQDPAVGAVGPRLRYPDGRLQHVGLLLGVCGVVAHAYHGAPADTEGYLASVLTVRNYSAVTGACLLTRRAIFDKIGGFDEAFPVDFNDVDYCLRVRRLGLRVVYTPHAELVHHESGTIGPRTQAGDELDRFRDRWAPVLSRDPYYNPNLTRHSPDWGFEDTL